LKNHAFTKIATGATVLGVCLVGFGTPAFAAVPAPSTTVAVNVDSTGALLTGQDESGYVKDGSSRSSLSADGKLVAFSTKAAAEENKNDVYNVFVKNLVTGELVSVTSAKDGIEANGSSTFPVLSADGTSVTFLSTATNLINTAAEKADGVNVYQKNLTTGEISLVSKTANGSPVNDVTSFAFSGDGSTVVFSSAATYVIDGVSDSEGTADLFRVKDGVTTLVTHAVDVEGLASDGQKTSPSLSFDGSVLTFTATETSNLNTDITPAAPQVFVEKDNLIVPVSDGFSDHSAVSADGSTVAYLATSEDKPDVQNVFVEDLVSGVSEQVNVNADGQPADQAPNDELTVSLTADGNKVLFTSASTNLDPRDEAYQQDVFLRDRAAGTTTLVSSNVNNTGSGDSISYDGVISPDGNFAVFASNARNLTTADVSANVTNMFVSNLAVAAGGAPTVTIPGQPDPGDQTDLSGETNPNQAVNGTGGTVDPTRPSEVTRDTRGVVGAPTATVNGDPNRTCADFRTQAEAKASGLTKLDNDNDGIYCEELPAGSSSLPKTGADGVIGSVTAGLTFLVLGAGAMMSRRFLSKGV
jgi:LPXTG-motif cell wall-anchored protein